MTNTHFSGFLLSKSYIGNIEKRGVGKKRRASGSKKVAWGKHNRESGMRSPRKIKQPSALWQERRKTYNIRRPFRARSNNNIFLG